MSRRRCATCAPSSVTLARSPGRLGRAVRVGQVLASSSRPRARDRQTGKLPVPLFCAGGIATPADASLVMQLGAESVFVGSGIFKSSDPPRFARAIVEATTHYRDATIVAKVSRGLGEAMRGEESGLVETKLSSGAGSTGRILAWEGSRQVVARSVCLHCKAMSGSTAAFCLSLAPSRWRCASPQTLPARGFDPARR